MIIKPDDGYICCIINPKSGASGNKLTAKQFEDYLTGKGFDVRLNLTSSLNDAFEFASTAAIDGNCAMVVAVGGDGTVRQVAHGIAHSDKPLLIVPCGTENLLANELGFEQNLNMIIRAFEAGYVRSLDLGCANGKYFTSIAGFGFDGEVVKKVSQQRQGHINHFDYFWPIWRTFWNHKFPAMKVEVDGQGIFDGRGLVFVGNISRYAIGLQILHYAEFGDGLLDICIYRCASRLHLVKHAFMTVLKRHIYCSDVIYQQGKNIVVSSNDNDLETQIDGDPGPNLPMQIEIIPAAVNCIVPEGSRPAGIRARIIRALR